MQAVVANSRSHQIRDDTGFTAMLVDVDEKGYGRIYQCHGQIPTSFDRLSHGDGARVG